MARRILELVELRRAMRRERVFRDRRNPLDIYNDEDLRKRYRFSREGILMITDIIAADIEHPTRRNCALPPYQQVLIALQYYATGTFHMVAGDPLQISQPTACRAIHRVTNALCRKINNFVKLPCEDILPQIMDGFYEMKGFPGVFSLIDGTHIWIISPHENEVDFVNRKGYHSINVQVMCDHRGRFMNIVAKWPGSVHDSRILRSSQIWDLMENGRIKAKILGDSGYPCRSWLMTPLLHVHTHQERRYNAAHKGTRVLIEQTIGRWKRRFHILHVQSRMKNPESTCKVICATAILHNIAIDRNEPLGPSIEPGRPQPNHEEYNGHLDGRRVRAALISQRF